MEQLLHIQQNPLILKIFHKPLAPVELKSLCYTFNAICDQDN